MLRLGSIFVALGWAYGSWWASVALVLDSVALWWASVALARLWCGLWPLDRPLYSCRVIMIFMIFN